MEFLGLMEAFGMDVGIGALEPDFDRVCRVDIDGMRVSFLEMPQSGQLVTWAAVCEPPPDGREQLYQMLMEAMFMGRETGGGAFSGRMTAPLCVAGGIALQMKAFELQIEGCYKYSLCGMYHTNKYSDLYWVLAYPRNIMISAGLFVHLW